MLSRIPGSVGPRCGACGHGEARRLAQLRWPPAGRRRLRCSSSAGAATPDAQRRRGPSKPTNIADQEGSPFFELGLRDAMEGMGRVRVRQHVNPLASQFQQPSQAPDWPRVFDDPRLPLFVDLGCGPGRFLLLLARRHGQQGRRMNYLGLEIRRPLVDRAGQWAAQLGLSGRVHYHFTNVSVSLAGLLAGYPGPVATLSAQFPDPHFKKRHRKRRMVQQSVVEAARELLAPGGEVFLQSDVFEAAAAMRDEFEQHASDTLQLSPLHSPGRVFLWTREQELEHAAAAATTAAPSEQQRRRHQQLQAQRRRGDGGEADAGGGGGEEEEEEEPDEAGAGEGGFESAWAAAGWLRENPVGVPTEREHYVQAQGGKVFRVLLVKQQQQHQR